jgi:hypothetical protein
MGERGAITRRFLPFLRDKCQEGNSNVFDIVKLLNRYIAVGKNPPIIMIIGNSAVVSAVPSGLGSENKCAEDSAHYTSKLLDFAATRLQQREKAIWSAHVSRANDNEIGLSAAKITIDLRKPVAVACIDKASGQGREILK